MTPDNPLPPVDHGPAVREAFIADLQMVVDHVRESLQKLRMHCELHGKDYSPVEEARWEGSFLALRGVLSDELKPMLRCWEQGYHFSRVGEEIAKDKEPT